MQTTTVAVHNYLSRMTMNSCCLPLLLSALLLSPTIAGTVSSSVQVHLPKELSRGNGYDHREALFGIPPYGGSIQQTVYYAGNELCTATANPDWKPPFILMVDRGGCTFVQKVRNAQHSGAAAVVIADNTCLCKFEKICTSGQGEVCEKREPIMADDGSGDDITIPSMLLFKQDADPIKSALVAGHPVRMELKWSLPNADNHVEYDLWTSPTDYASREFKSQFKDAAVALKDHATFTPHMYIYDGIEAKCRNDHGDNECYNLCTNVGRYCATDPDNDLDAGISGADVVTESLRSICIWELYGKEDGVGTLWWDYNKIFIEKCDNDQDFMKEVCVKDVMEQVGIDETAVNDCIKKSGGLEDPSKNNILDKELDDKERHGIIVMPVAYVNGVPIRGALEFPVIFKAICAGFATGTAPSICEKCSTCDNEHQCVLDGYCKSKGVKGSTFATSMAMTVIVFAALAVFQHQRAKRQVREQVKGILAEYMPLEKEGMMGQDTSLGFDDDDEEDVKTSPVIT